MTLVLLVVLAWLGLNLVVVLADFALVLREDRVVSRRGAASGPVAGADQLPHR
jgi:hypothetical protein